MQEEIKPIEGQILSAKRDVDDKDLVIGAVTIIAIIAMFAISDPETIITAVVSGLFGIAVGRKI